MAVRHRFGRFELHAVERRLLADGAPLHLGARAFDVLLQLVERRGALVSKAELLDGAWGGLVVEEGNVQVQVSALRKLLGPEVVATVPGRGYRLALPLDEAAPPPDAMPDATADAPLGRDADLATLRGWIAAGERLVTVLGAGGVGKTRLARAVAQTAAGRLPVGWVDLAALDAPAQIAPAIAAAVGVELADGDPRLGLSRALTAQPLLLMLDNCEHLADGVAALAATLLAAAPRLQLLATSQQPLRIAGERVYRLDGLALPAADATLAEALCSPALQLLQACVARLDRHFRIDATNLRPAVSLCRRLDGHPLAIEMAAARVPSLGVGALEAMLDARLALLHGDDRLAPPRQHTLRALLDWSHALLDAAEQAVLRRLAVCAGSLALETVEQLAADGTLDHWALLDALGRLVDRSLVHCEAGEPPRYRLPETTRLYALERLDAAGERERTEQRHGEALARLVGPLRERYLTRPDAEVLSRHGADHDDLQRAFERACTRGDAEVAAATLAGLAALDQLRGVASGMPARLARVQPLLPQASALARARIWTAIAACGWARVPGTSPSAAARLAVAAWHALGDRLNRHHALLLLSTELARQGGLAEADEVLAAAQALEQPGAPTKLRLRSTIHAGWLCMFRGDYAGCRAQMHAAGALARETGATRMLGFVAAFEADAARQAGDLPAAITIGRRAVDALRGSGQAMFLAKALLNLAAALRSAGQLGATRAVLREALPLALQQDLAGELFDALAEFAEAQGGPDTAARLRSDGPRLGAEDALALAGAALADAAPDEPGATPSRRR